MAREDIGEIDHHCGTVAAVRRNKHGRLYVACPACGLLPYALDSGQDYILNNARMYGPEGKPPPEKPADGGEPAPTYVGEAPPPAAEPAPYVTEKPAPKSKQARSPFCILDT